MFGTKKESEKGPPQISLTERFNRGRSFLESQLFDNAIEDFNEVIKLDPYHQLAYNGL